MAVNLIKSKHLQYASYIMQIHLFLSFSFFTNRGEIKEWMCILRIEFYYGDDCVESNIYFCQIFDLYFQIIIRAESDDLMMIWKCKSKIWQ